MRRASADAPVRPTPGAMTHSRPSVSWARTSSRRIERRTPRPTRSSAPASVSAVSELRSRSIPSSSTSSSPNRPPALICRSRAAIHSGTKSGSPVAARGSGGSASSSPKAVARGAATSAGAGSGRAPRAAIAACAVAVHKAVGQRGEQGVLPARHLLQHRRPDGPAQRLRRRDHAGGVGLARQPAQVGGLPERALQPELGPQRLHRRRAHGGSIGGQVGHRHLGGHGQGSAVQQLDQPPLGDGVGPGDQRVDRGVGHRARRPSSDPALVHVRVHTSAGRRAHAIRRRGWAHGARMWP